MTASDDKIKKLLDKELWPQECVEWSAHSPSLTSNPVYRILSFVSGVIVLSFTGYFIDSYFSSANVFESEQKGLLIFIGLILFIAPFIIGLVLCLAPIVLRGQSKPTYYIITNKRFLVFSPQGDGDVLRISGHQIKSIETDHLSNGLMNLTLWGDDTFVDTTQGRDGQNLRFEDLREKLVVIYGVSKGDCVENLLIRLQKSH